MTNPSFLIFLAVSLIFTACNYNIPKAPVVEENTNTGIQKTQGQLDEEKRLLTEDPLILSNTSEFKTIPCNGREIEILKDATSNTFKLTGECKKITVDGVSNEITVDKVGEIVVTGTSNKVIYGEGIDGKKPKISKSGISTSVDSMQTLKDKKEKEAANKQ